MEGKLVIGAATQIDEPLVGDESAGIDVPVSGHSMDERPPAPVIVRQTRAAKKVVEIYVAAIKTAAIKHETEVGMIGEKDIFKGPVPTAITLPYHDVCQ